MKQHIERLTPRAFRAFVYKDDKWNTEQNLGRLLLTKYAPNAWVALDNTGGEALVEQFPTKASAEYWLKHPDTTVTQAIAYSKIK